VLLPPVQTLAATIIFAKGEKANRFRSQKSPAPTGLALFGAGDRRIEPIAEQHPGGVLLCVAMNDKLSFVW
jgi:hypothetical protein